MESVQGRFIQLVGIIKHEYWLHQQRPEDYGFVADLPTLTIRAVTQHDGGEKCELRTTPDMLNGDLHSLAVTFYRRMCHGLAALAKGPREKHLW
jgi:hypothetical protein